MDHLSSGTHKQFKSLIDLVAADHPGASKAFALGPCVGDDGPVAPSLTVLGPCVGDDGPPSDIRLKEDVRSIGTTVFGLSLYQFRYRGKPETYEGVMAHEVLQVMPRAVSVAADGFYRVNYNALGISMRRVS
jgi:hypothetical protein